VLPGGPENGRQHETSLEFARQALGDNQANSAEPASNEIYASNLEAVMLRSRGQINWFHGLNEPFTMPECN